MKRGIVISLLLVCAVPVHADHDIDWDDWYDGDVRVKLRVGRGEGAIYGLGEPVWLEFEANEDAYHLVYAIDTEGRVRLLFPRYWEDDGWVPEGEEVELHAEDLAWPADRWGSTGIVYVEAVASPLPFDFAAMGVGYERGCSVWFQDGRPFRIAGDPFLAFNDVHRLIFPGWDAAVFAVDYTFFHVGRVYEAPRYLGYGYRRVYVAPPDPGFYVGLRFRWRWEFGGGYCRPVYTSYYVPGVHVVHHSVHHHHHVVYDAYDGRERHGPAFVERQEPRRVVHEPSVTRQRDRAVRQRARTTAMPAERAAADIGAVLHRVVERKREASPEPLRVGREPATPATRAGRERREVETASEASGRGRVASVIRQTTTRADRKPVKVEAGGPKAVEKESASVRTKKHR